MSPSKETSPESKSEALAAQIKELAGQGNFTEAERLRERLLQDDPMALKLIISTGDLIEEEKSRQLDPDHLAIWQDLYEGLSPEEINALYYGSKPATVAQGKLLLAQGNINNRLFFIEGGKVGVFYRKEKKNVPVIDLGRGDILGEDTFFGISLCTLSAVTQAEVRLRHLSYKDAEAWHESQPGLFEKVRDYCLKAGKSDLAVRKNNLERRRHPRFAASGVAIAYLIDQQGRKSATYFKGGVIDLSRNGVSFSMKCSKQETARALLAREVELSLVLEAEEEQSLSVRGTIVKVHFYLHNDYSVHVRLGELFTEAQFKAFPCDWDAGEQNP